jgi:hypothetical protein
MAKHASHRWLGWRTDLHGGTIRDRDPAKLPPKDQRGITNKQAKLLAKLQRLAGEPYSGRGMTAAQADAAIKRLLNKKRGPARSAGRPLVTPQMLRDIQEIRDLRDED